MNVLISMVGDFLKDTSKVRSQQRATKKRTDTDPNFFGLTW
jgi:hypothetical protein